MSVEAGADAVGAKKVLTEYIESAAVELALEALPPIKTVGDCWYEYRSGAWRLTDFNKYRPIVLSVMAPSIATNKRCHDVLKHIEGQKQVEESEFKSFYCFYGDAVLLNAANGVVRVGPEYDFQLLPHDAAHKFTRQLAAVYDPLTRCPNFERVLAEALPDSEDRVLFQLFAGYLLLPSCKYEAALVCYGPSGTGKSTVSEPIAAVFGTELIERISMSNICDPKGYSLPKLKHVAFNLGTELDALEVGESGNFKALVSGEPIDVRPIYGRPFTMTTTMKLWFLSNNLPRFKYGTDAEQRRTRFLRFDKFPTFRDVDLKEKLKSERDGVFHWCLEGLSRLLTLKEMPLGGAESRGVHERFAVSNDPLSAFMDTRCRIDSTSHTPKEQFKTAVQEFYEAAGIPCENDAWIFRQLWDRFPQLREVQQRLGGTRTRVIQGVALQPSA